MEEKGQDRVALFDKLYTTNRMQMMKVILPYLEFPVQNNIAVFIKLSELQYTLTLSQKRRHFSLQAASKEEPPDPLSLFEELLPYCSPAEREQLQHMQGLFRNFTNMKDMFKMMQSFKELFPEGENPLGEGMFSSGNPFSDGNFNFENIADILSNLNNPDISQLMNLFSS